MIDRGIKMVLLWVIIGFAIGAALIVLYACAAVSSETPGDGSGTSFSGRYKENSVKIRKRRIQMMKRIITGTAGTAAGKNCRIDYCAFFLNKLY